MWIILFSEKSLYSIQSKGSTSKKCNWRTISINLVLWLSDIILAYKRKAAFPSGAGLVSSLLVTLGYWKCLRIKTVPQSISPKAPVTCMERSYFCTLTEQKVQIKSQSRSTLQQYGAKTNRKQFSLLGNSIF